MMCILRGIGMTGLILCLLHGLTDAAEIPCGHGPFDPLLIPDIVADKTTASYGTVKAVEPVEPSDFHEVVDAGSGVTLTCYFKDPDGVGFRDPSSGAARRERLYDAVGYIASVVAPAAPRTLVIVVNPSGNDSGSGVPVAYCGPVLIPEGNLLVPLAWYHLDGVTPPSGYTSYPDMLLTVNWFYAWHEAPTPPPADRLDLISVLIHELTHGLGFNGVLCDSTPAGSGTFTRFDRLIGRANGSPLVDQTSVYEGTAQDLVSETLVFLGSEAAVAYGTYPPLYAPDPYVQGTSLEHWDPQRLGSMNAVMKPSYLTGSAMRQYAPFEIAALRDLGYADAGASGLPACPLTGITILEPRENPRITAGDRVSVTVTAQPDYAQENCSLVTTGTRLEYYLDGVYQGASTNDTLRFPLLIQVTEGSHTLRAVATEQESGSSDETTITFRAIYDPGRDAVTLTPAGTVDFGGVVRGKTVRRMFQVRNDGVVPAGIQVTIEGDPVFTLGADPPVQIGAGQTVGLEVIFRPPDSGRVYQAVLRIAADHGQFLESALTGQGRSLGLFYCGTPEPVPRAHSLAGDSIVLSLTILALGFFAGRQTADAADH